MRLKYLACIFTLLPMLFSCQHEDMDQPVVTNKELSITLAVPYIEDAGNPVTYAMPGDEGTVNTVDMLAFETDPANPTDVTKGTYLYRATVGNLIKNPAGGATFNTVLSAHNKNQTLVVLVNCRQEVNTLLNTITSGVTTKKEVLDNLTLTQATAFDPSTMTGMPMWGEITNQNITANYNPPGGLTVGLTRMLAKINISNAENTATFTLTRAWLYNPRQKGSIIPDNWDAAGYVTKPTPVTNAEMTQGTNFGSIVTSAVNEIKNKIYTFEANNAAKANNNLLDATCLVVAGRYKGNGIWSYYRIDLKNYTTGDFFDLLRNHSYNITITKVEDDGAPGVIEAYKGISRITANVEVWNIATGQVQYGPDNLYVSNRYPFAKLDGTESAPGTKDVRIRSTTDWKFDESDATTIATLAWANPTKKIGSAGDEVFSFTPTTGIATGREGKAKIIAGNLSYTIVFMQDDCGTNGIALSQKIGTKSYKTHQYPTGPGKAMECWMVENLKEEHQTLAAKMYEYDPKKAIGYYYTPGVGQSNDPCPDEWSLPTATQWTNMREHMKKIPAADRTRGDKVLWFEKADTGHLLNAGTWDGRPPTPGQWTWQGWGYGGYAAYLGADQASIWWASRTSFIDPNWDWVIRSKNVYKLTARCVK